MSDPYAPQSLIPGTNGLSIWQLWTMLWARKWVVIGVGAAVLLLTILFTFLQAKRYEATGTILVEYKASDPTLLQGFSANLEASYLNTQAQLLGNRRVMISALQRIGLDQDGEALQKFRSKGSSSFGSFEDWLAGKYLKDLTVDADVDSRLVDVTFESEDPVGAARLVNALIDAYLTSSTEITQSPAEQRAERFKKQVDDARAMLDEAEQALTDYQQSEELIDLSERVNSQQEKLRNLTDRYVAAQTQVQALQSRMELLEQMRARGLSADERANLLQGQSETLREQRARLATLETRRAELARTLGPNHPQRIALDAEVQSLRRQVGRDVTRAINALSSEANLAVQQENDLKQRLDEQRALVLGLERKNDRLEALRRDLSVAESRYNRAVGRYDEVAVGAESGDVGVTVVRRAVPPTEASSPNKLLNLIAGAFVGGALGVLLALLIELVFRRVRCAEDVTREFGVPVMAEVA